MVNNNQEKGFHVIGDIFSLEAHFPAPIFLESAYNTYHEINKNMKTIYIFIVIMEIKYKINANGR